MYTHYLLTTMKVNTNAWKKYITQMQMIQFFLIALHDLQLFWEDCDYPVWPTYIMVPQNFFMFILFADFYYKAYIKKKPVAKTMTTKINGISVDISNGKQKEQ